MKLLSNLATGIVTACVFVCSAQATPVWSLSARGVISDGVDKTGLFGSAGRDLAGLRFTQTLTAFVDPGTEHDNVSYGRELGGYDVPGFTGSVTVNGKTVEFNVPVAGASFQRLYESTPPGPLGLTDKLYSYQYGVDEFANSIWVLLSVGMYGNSPSFVPALDFSQKINIDASLYDTAFSFHTSDGSGLRAANFNGKLTALAVNDVLSSPEPGTGPGAGGGNGGAPTGNGSGAEGNPAKVPEPASVALLGLGILGVGAVRRRKAA